MEYSEKQYDLSDREIGQNFASMDKAIRKEMKKQEKPKTKPQEVFEGFKEKNKTKSSQKRKPLMRFAKEKKVDYRQ